MINQLENRALQPTFDKKNLNPIERAQANPQSKRMAIDAYCYDCSYDQTDAGNWRQQVGACTHVTCPLFNHRPTSKGANNG